MMNKQAIKILEDLRSYDYDKIYDLYQNKPKSLTDAFNVAIQALQTDRGLNEWCHDCKEYDQEKHCCPRFNRVIRDTLAEIQADGDLISRHALLDRLDDFNKWCKDGRLQGTLFAVDVINDMSSVAIPNAEPKEVYYSGDGYANGEMVYDIANCPNCDYEFEESDSIWGCKFCPECGQALEWEGEHE